MQVKQLTMSNQSLQLKLQKKDQMLQKMKEFQNDLCKTYEKARSEMGANEHKHQQKLHQLKMELEEFKTKYISIEQENTLIIAQQQVLENTLKEKSETIARQEAQIRSLQSQNSHHILQSSHLHSNAADARSSASGKKAPTQSKSQDKRDAAHLANDTSADRIYCKTLEDQENQDYALSRSSQKKLLGGQAPQQFLSKSQQNFGFPLQICRELNAKNESECLSALKRMVADLKQQKKLIECLEDMVTSCVPAGYFGSRPTLKQMWKWLKQMVCEYMKLKKDYLKEGGCERDVIKCILECLELERVEDICPCLEQILLDKEILVALSELIKQKINISEKLSFQQIYQALELVDIQVLNNFQFSSFSNTPGTMNPFADSKLQSLASQMNPPTRPASQIPQSQSSSMANHC